MKDIVLICFVGFGIIVYVIPLLWKFLDKKFHFEEKIDKWLKT